MNRAQIKKAIQRQHPAGWVSKMGSSKLVRPRMRPENLPGKGREASVMLLIYPSVDNANLQIVLTRRRDDLQHHPGQVSLPGGRREPEETIEQAALREVEEEIGIDQSIIEVVGQLNPVYVPPSDFTVFPFVGWLSKKPSFKLQAEEVAELILAPLKLILDPSIRQFSSVETDSKPRDVPWFSIQEHQVWGATAIILDDFVQRLHRQLSI